MLIFVILHLLNRLIIRRLQNYWVLHETLIRKTKWNGAKESWNGKNALSVSRLVGKNKTIRRIHVKHGGSSDWSHTYEWQCTYISLVSCGFNDSVTTILHSLSHYDCRIEAFPLIFSEKIMFVFSFRLHILSNRRLRTCSEPQELIRNARATIIGKLYTSV